MKLLDAYIWQIPINELKDDYYNILEGQILDSVVMIIVRFLSNSCGRVGRWKGR